ncbi:hypothetical protein C922_01886 [Plasmodium inui San Antonio 1]|uniref:Uncharacterized protein n=1 Tax=Plasmodium inui San Antonio 1 TaxID=1237626 RepID=W7A8T6_9APIC|nr:hypothetical protein C922_01886 [Plasmodium inui San Antonio 1]EUD67698.1 hypothetical protein C922_01886 [Plasmodium inui San Antonio 1]
MENYESPSEVLKKKGKIEQGDKVKEKKDKLKFIDIFNDSNDAEKSDNKIEKFLKKKKITESRRKAKNKNVYLLEGPPNVYATDLVSSSFASSSVANSGTPDVEKNIPGTNSIQRSTNLLNNLSIFANEGEQNHGYLVNEIYRLKAEVEEEKQKGCRTNEETKLLKEKNDILSKSISDMKIEMEKLQNIYDEEVVKIKESYERRLLIFQTELEEKENYFKKQKEAHREEFESQLEEYKTMYHNEKRKSQDRERLIEEAAIERDRLTKEAAIERDRLSKAADAELEHLQNRVTQMSEREKDLTQCLNEEKEKSEEIKTQAEKYKQEAEKYKEEAEKYKQEAEKYKEEAEKYKQQVLNLNEIISKKNENIKNMVNDILLVKNVYDELAKEKELNELGKKKLVKKIDTYEKDLHYLKNNMEGYRVNNDKLRKCNQELNERARKLECQIRSLQNENEFLKKENLLFNKKFLNVKREKKIEQLNYFSDSTDVKDEEPSADSSGEGNNSLVSRKDDVQVKEVKLMGQANEIRKVKHASGEHSADEDKCTKRKKKKNKKNVLKKKKKNFAKVVKRGEKGAGRSDSSGDGDSDGDSDHCGEDGEGASSIGEDRPVEPTCALSLLTTTGRGKRKDARGKKKGSISGTPRGKNESGESGEASESDKSDAGGELNESDEAGEANLSTLSRVESKPNSACCSEKEVHLSDMRRSIGNLVIGKKLKGNTIGPNYEEVGTAGRFDMISKFLQNGSKDEKKKKKKKEKEKEKEKRTYDYSKTNFSATSLGSSKMFNKDLGSNRYLFDLNLYSLKRYNIFSFSNGVFPQSGEYNLTDLVRKKRSCPARMGHLDDVDNLDKMPNLHMSTNNTWRSRTEGLYRALRDSSCGGANGGEEADSVEASPRARILQGGANSENHTNDDMERNKTIDYFLSNIKKGKKHSNEFAMKGTTTRLQKLLSGRDSSSGSCQMGKGQMVSKLLRRKQPVECEQSDHHGSAVHSGGIHSVGDTTANELGRYRNHLREDHRDMQSYLLSKCKGKNNIYGLFIINERLKSIYKNIANKRKSISNFPVSMPKIENQKQFSSSFDIIHRGKVLPEVEENTSMVVPLGCKKNAHEMVPPFEHRGGESNGLNAALQKGQIKRELPLGDETKGTSFTSANRLTEQTRSAGSAFVVSGEDPLSTDEKQMGKNLLLENSRNMNRVGKKGEPSYTQEENDEEGIFLKKKNYLGEGHSISVMFDKNQPSTGGYLPSNESHSIVATNGGETHVRGVDGETLRSMAWHPLYQEGMEKCVSFVQVRRKVRQEGQDKVGRGPGSEGPPPRERLSYRDGPVHHDGSALHANELRDNEFANHLNGKEGRPRGNPQQTGKNEEHESVNKFDLNDVFNSNFNNFLLSYKSKKREIAVSPASAASPTSPSPPASSSPSRNRIFEILETKNSPYDHSKERNCIDSSREDSYFEDYLNGLKQKRSRARVGEDPRSVYVRRVDKEEQQTRSTDKPTQRGSNKWDLLAETEKFIKQDSPQNSNGVEDPNARMENNANSGGLFGGGSDCPGDSNGGNIKKESERFLFSSNSVMNTGSNSIGGTTYKNVVRSHIENAHFTNFVKNKRQKNILLRRGDSNSGLCLTNQECNTSNRSDELNWKKSP